MSKIDYQALREAAERAIPAMERLLMLPVDDDLLTEQELKDYGVDIDALNAFKFLTGPETVLALLDERERNQQYIKSRDQENEDIALTVGKLRVELEGKDSKIANLTAERDALREGDMGDARHSNTRVAADIYFQLVEECEIPAGGSLVEYVDDMREKLEAAEKRIAELESLTEPQLPHQAPVSVPDAATAIRACIDEFPESVRDIVEECASIAENACLAAMLQGAKPVSNRDDLTDDFISMLTGRAKYLREKGEIKSPYLLERAAAALKGENADTTPIPNGWKLVPIDPTKDMLRAGQSVVGFWLNTVHCYSKMLAAAPAAPQLEVNRG